MLAATIAHGDLIRKDRMAPGDRVLVTKGVAVEGTAIIAREFGDQLKNLGMNESEIDSGRRFLANISIRLWSRIRQSEIRLKKPLANF